MEVACFVDQQPKFLEKNTFIKSFFQNVDYLWRTQLRVNFGKAFKNTFLKKMDNLKVFRAATSFL
jgi:hypothetical protein